MSLDISIQSGGWVIISRIKPLIQFVRSLKFQGFMVVFFVTLCSLIIYSRILMASYDKNAYDYRVSTIREYGTTIANNLSVPGSVTKDSITEYESEIKYFSSMYDGRTLVIDKNLRVLFDTFGLEKDKTLISEDAIASLGGKESIYRNSVKNYVELILPITNTNDKSVIGILVFSFSLKAPMSIGDKLSYTASTILVILGAIVMIIAFGYAFSVSKALGKLSSEIDKITDGNIEEIDSVYSYTELEAVSSSFNKMLKKAKKLEGSRQEFVSNVSHELKTPMTSMKVLADSLLSQPDASVEMYREFLTDINNEIEREDKIINDLLSLVKFDRKTGTINVKPTDLNELLEQILKRLRPIAVKNHVELIFESFRAVTAEVDEVKLSLALSNLIENAIKYNKEDGWVRVSLNADHKFFFVKVVDSGIGIPEEFQDQIFERFYRVDKARSRGTGGTGLGLSITKNVVMMHHGEIRLYSKEDDGTTFTVRIPLSYIPPKPYTAKKKGGGFRLARL